jgi:hypothetical protein
MRKFMVAVLCLVPSLCLASNWQVIDRKEKDWTSYLSEDDANVKGVGVLQHSTVSISIDRDSIATQGAVKRVWWKETAAKNGRVMDLIFLTSFDCLAHRLRTEKAGHRYSLTLPYSWDEVITGSGYDIEPDDPSDYVFGAVCLNK